MRRFNLTSIPAFTKFESYGENLKTKADCSTMHEKGSYEVEAEREKQKEDNAACFIKFF